MTSAFEELQRDARPRLPWWVAHMVPPAIVAVIIWRTFARQWDAHRSIHVALVVRPWWLALSTMLIFAGFATQIQAWRRVLAGWGQPLAYSAAARACLLGNLGRYVPGEVWGVAALGVLAQRAGGPAGAAAASAFVLEAVVLGTGPAGVAGATSAAAPAL